MPGLNVKIYECYVTGVHANDRILDANSKGGTVFRGASYLLPWISMNGSGIDCIPKTGDNCIILSTTPSNDSQGRLSFCIGFKLPASEAYNGLELGQRIEGLPQGSMGFRAVAEDGNEALVLLTRGGTAVIGANGVCRTLYSPVDSSVITIFNNWELSGPGGFVKWMRDAGNEVVEYRSQYRVSTAEEEGVRVDIRVGGADADPVNINIGMPNSDQPFLQVLVDKDGKAWLKGESINIVGRAGVTIDGAEVKIKNRQVLGQGDPI